MKRRGLIHNRKDLTGKRRELRRSATPAEALLWSAVRGDKLDGWKFRRQHSIGPYIADFYCPECRVVIELDGAVHAGLLEIERDGKRTEFFAALGIQVIRFENREILENREYVLETIRRVLKERFAQLHGNG